MKSNKYENLKSLEKRKTKEREKKNLVENISPKGKLKGDLRHKGKKIDKQLLKSKIALDKILSKAQEDRISLGKLRQINTQKISHSISLFEVQFLFDYFFFSLKSFKFRHLPFGRASPGNYSFFSSLLFSFLLFISSFIKK